MSAAPENVSAQSVVEVPTLSSPVGIVFLGTRLSATKAAEIHVGFAASGYIANSGVWDLISTVLVIDCSSGRIRDNRAPSLKDSFPE